MVEHGIDVLRVRGSSPLLRTMIILGIETSCDETAMCLIETKNTGLELEYKVLGNIIHSQINLHSEYGGVFPMLAKREHEKNLPIIYKEILKISKINEEDIDKISVTQGPGLEPALWTGIVFAKELAGRLDIPIIPTNHMEGHIVSSLITQIKNNKDFIAIKKPEFPALAILISGGHTEIVKINEIGKYEILGTTVDDALGEAFDKVARMMNIPYPGGPKISELAEKARNRSLKYNVKLPRPMINSKDLKFSFSGLKTAVLYFIKQHGELNEEIKEEIALEFEESVTEVLIQKTKKAMEENETRSILLGGGVIANKYIRKAFENLSNEYNIPFFLPENSLTGDNALMIAIAGAIKPSSDYEGFKADGNLSL